eukprot:m.111081 g.111081  ORF g.111081 m.111081 type:complete len:602 (-) comp12912_c0_seq3:209-2014(-)
MVVLQWRLMLLFSVLATVLAACDPDITLDSNGHLDFPGTIPAIAPLQFKDCTNLRSVTFADTLTDISLGAFWGTSLSTVVIPDSVTRVGDSAFMECSGLSSVVIGGNVTSIGGGAFGRGGLRSVEIPNSVTLIGNQAFASNPFLENAFISDSVRFLGHEVFKSCTALNTVYLSRHVDLNESNDVFQFTGCPEDVFSSGVAVCRCGEGSCAPTSEPTAVPTVSPTSTPTGFPTITPTAAPSVMPTALPTNAPTLSPTAPTASPTATPTSQPSVSPSVAPTQSTASPTEAPSVVPTSTPTVGPTAVPTEMPTTVHILRETPGPRNEYSASLLATMVVIPLVLIGLVLAFLRSLRLYTTKRPWRRRSQVKPLLKEKVKPILVSYATDFYPRNRKREGEQAMYNMVTYLEENDIPCFHCNKGIVGALWRPEWFGRVPKTEVAIVMLSPGFYKSRHCLLELHALLDSKVEQDNHIIPVIVEDPEGTDTEEALMAVFKKEGMFPSREEVNVNFLRRFQKKNRLPKNGTYVPARDNVEILRLIHKFTSISEKFDGESAPETEDATDTSDTEDAATPQLNPDLAQSTEATAEVGATSEPASTDVSVSMV